VLISRLGYVKAQAVRGSGGMSGAEAMAERDGDFVRQTFVARGSTEVLLFTAQGSVHCLPVKELPRGTRSSRGKQISDLVDLAAGDRIVSVVPVPEFDSDRYLLFVTRDGQVKRTALSEYSNVRAGGIRAIGLAGDDEVMMVRPSVGTGDLLLATRNGLAIRFAEEDVRVMGRTARGVRGIELPADYQQVRDRFLVMSGFRTWTAQEDVAMGPNLQLGATFSDSQTGGDITRVLVNGSVSRVWRSGNWMVTSDGWFRGRWDDWEPRNWVGGIQAAVSQIGTRGLQARLLVEGSHELDLDQQLTLGADVGLRGWDPDYFDGTGRALVNLQWRTLVKRDLFQLFSLGVVVFGDAGMTWDARVGPGTDGVRADIGAGLLFDLTTFGRADVLRVEVCAEGIRLTTFFEPPRIVPAIVREIDLLKHRVLLEPLPENKTNE